MVVNDPVLLQEYYSPNSSIIVNITIDHFTSHIQGYKRRCRPQVAHNSAKTIGSKNLSVTEWIQNIEAAKASFENDLSANGGEVLDAQVVGVSEFAKKKDDLQMMHTTNI